MVGSAVYKLLKKKHNIIDCKRKSLDLLSQSAVDLWFKKNNIDVVINCAGRVGGILENSLRKEKFLKRKIFSKKFPQVTIK